MEGEENLESLFEGMVLMIQSQQLSPESESNSQPLDENLFSDLNLCSVNEDQIRESHGTLGLDPCGIPKENDSLKKESSSLASRSLESSGNRQSSRRKKKSFKIGYGRGNYSLEDGLQDHSNVVSVNADSSSSSSVSAQAYTKAVHQGQQIQFMSTEIRESKDDGNDNNDIRGESKSSSQMPGSSDFDGNHRTDSVKSQAIHVPSSEAEDSIGIPEHEEIVENREDDRKLRETVNEATYGSQTDGDLLIRLQNSVQIELQDERAEAVFDVTGQGRSERTSEIAIGDSVEEKLASIKAQVLSKLEQLQERAASISISRKAAAQRRRQAADEVVIASNKYRELEKELEDACEREDFDRAECLSQSLLIVEKSKDEAINAFRSAETDCDCMASKMQEILESQVEVEEDGVQRLMFLEKEAAGIADTVIKDAEDTAFKQMEKWLVEKEALELKKMEVDLELKVIEDADVKLKESIDDSVREDIKEKKLLSEKRETLMQELQNLLALVRAKEAEIVENDNKVQDVEKRISVMTSKFEDARVDMKTKSEELQSVVGQLKSTSEVLSMKKKEADELLAVAEEKKIKLYQLAGDAGEEARLLQELVGLKKSIVSSFLEARENKLRLAEKEKQVSEEVQILRKQVATARASLQELSSTKANLHQEITSTKQKILFIEKRGPELEAEKKVAAAARNFREAGRVANEAKSLSLEKDTASTNLERAFLELQKLEEEINGRVNALKEAENLILSKEREAAMARCERLRLVAAAARGERSAALELEDIEEAESLLAEAEAADSEADKLQEVCNFDGEQFMKISKQVISVAVASTLMGKRLADKSTCIQTSVE